MNINKRLLQYVKTMRIYVVIVALLSFLTAIFIVLQSHYIAHIINQAFLNKQNVAQLLTPLIILLCVLVGRAVVIGSNDVATNMVSGTVKGNLRLRLFRHILKLGPMYVKGERSGEIANTTTEAVEALDAYFNLFFPQVCATVIIPVVILIMVFSTDALSGVVLLVTWPVLPVFMILIGLQANAMTEKRWQQMSHLSAHFLDVLQGMTTLKLFGRNKLQQETIRRMSDRYGDTTMSVLRVAFLSSFVMEMGSTISNAIIAVEIGLRLLYGNIPFEQAFFVLLLTPEFYQPLRNLGTQFHASMNSAAGAQRIFDILETPATEQSLPVEASTLATGTSTAIPTLTQTLTLRDVHYTYPSNAEAALEQEALKGISFEIHHGQKVALVGKSGAGKSTIASLLLRFIDPAQGALLADGQDIRTCDARDWRKLVAWQPQRPYLFNTTVADNIRLGRPEASMEEVIAAARLAQFDTVVQELPQGYETRIGERGTRLSGGQLQRLSLARALIKQSPLLLLDEATSTLDAESEHHILQTIDQVAQDHFVLVIAHRLHTIQSAHRILVLDEGRIVDSGTHHELLATSPLYQELVKAYEEEEAIA
ncbi:thiol reductant ABC exporter subunit CydD [Dictyobacter arantiisoli]|uniref:Thiol reductant ABC exporter subunit CydD n=1 Tax=Dictyobacter arantiisoli TaxID=2014874 RepID=A0A5A5T6V1_9CHLR|nr:thiol reductant ABC exporter subunit CydD [Dictyobacter arantiisoli]GCF07200.1 thiol reductant ABC exporter subunit CydD [Dictyobacter arantiisoli]